MSLLPGSPYDAGIGGIFGRGPSWLPQGAAFGQQPQGGFMNGLKGLLGNPDLAMALLANSGYSPQKRSFGEILGTSMLQANQAKQGRADDELMSRYREAQIKQLEQGPGARTRKPVIIAGPDGKPIYVDEPDAIGKSPFLASGDGVGDYQPGDYTPASWSKFVAGGMKDPSTLERYVAPRQETSKPFQNITRTYPDGSTQQGNFDTRTGEFIPAGPVIPAGIKPRVEAAGTAAGKIEGERSVKSPRAYDAFQTGMAGLENAMSQTQTGPILGRVPALTASQQIAEGAEATMAPVLKQLFRDAGEGVFTDKDQELLMKMVPTRKDHPEARKAKIAMIDSIVRAKLGIGDLGQSSAQPQSGPKPGTVEGGYRFKGGNPADQNNWEPVK